MHWRAAVDAFLCTHYASVGCLAVAVTTAAVTAPAFGAPAPTTATAAAFAGIGAAAAAWDFLAAFSSRKKLSKSSSWSSSRVNESEPSESAHTTSVSALVVSRCGTAWNVGGQSTARGAPVVSGFAKLSLSLGHRTIPFVVLHWVVEVYSHVVVESRVARL